MIYAYITTSQSWSPQLRPVFSSWLAPSCVQQYIPVEFMLRFMVQLLNVADGRLSPCSRWWWLADWTMLDGVDVESERAAIRVTGVCRLRISPVFDCLMYVSVPSPLPH